MKKFSRVPIWVVLGIGVAMSASCGGGDEVAEDTTMEDLEAGGFSFSVDEYHRAAREGDTEALALFHEGGMEVDATTPDGMTALFVAADNGQKEAVAELVEEGADVAMQLPGGKSPLIAAATNGHAETVKVLLEAGANAEARDGQNWTPLTRAAFEGHAETVKVLAPKSRTELDPALHLAAVSGNTQTVDALLNAGASVFARSNENKTALMYAAANGNFDVVKVLLQNGSNRFAIDESGKTPAQMAQMEGHVAVADYLLEPPTDAERSIPENPVLAGLNPERDEFTPGDVSERTPVVSVKNGAGSESIMANRQPLPRRIDGAVVAARLPVEAASAPGEELGELGEEGEFGEGDISTPDPVVRGGIVEKSPGSEHPAASPEIAGGSIGEAGPVALPKKKVAAVAETLRMHDYRESQLPVMLDDVVGETATVRVLYGGTDAVEVKAGEKIGETGLEVVEVRRRFITSKQGKGDAVNVSEIEIRDVESGKRMLVVKDVPAKSNDIYALMSIDGTGDLYDVRRDDRFTAEVEELGKVQFRVVDVRPTQVVLENIGSGEAFTIARSSYGL